MSDYPRANIPLDGIYASENVLLHHGGRVEGRDGTRLLDADHANLPTVSGGSSISASKASTSITISAGYTPSSSNIGDYFVWPDNGKNELITGVSGQVLTVSSSSVHTSTTSGRIRQEVNAAIWDKENNKHVKLVGTKLYYADWNVTSWTEVNCVSEIKPDNSKSNLKQLGSEIYLNNKNGTYVINLSDTYPTLERINNTIDECTITSVAKTDELVYERRYTVTLAKMSGNMLSCYYSGSEVVRETPPYSVDGDGKDYAEVFTTLPIGDESDDYSRLRGNYVVSEGQRIGLIALSNAQYKITLNSVTINMIVDFTGCSTWPDIINKLKAVARWWFPAIDIYIEDGYLTIENKAAESVLGYCSAGDSGTDISNDQYLALHNSTFATITTQYLSTSSVVGDMSVPNYLSESYYYYCREYTHYRVYAATHLNNIELYVHVADIPIVKALICEFDGTATVTATKGSFSISDVGSTLYYSLGTSSKTILTFISSSQVVLSDLVNATDDGPASIGSSKPIRFSQSGTVVAMTSYSENADDSFIGARLFASDGSTSIITSYNGSTELLVDTPATKTSLGGVIIKRSSSATAYTRKFNDTITDDTLSYRIKNHLCKNRFWQPLPNCDLGTTIEGFMVSAVKNGSSIYQTQLANKRFTGYYDPDFQIDTVQDSIQALRAYPGLLSAICSQSTVSWSTEVIGTDSRPDIGLSTSFLTQRNTVDEHTGTMFPESIASVDEGMDIVFTNNHEVRLFDGRSYGPNLAEGKIMKRLRKLQHYGASSYDSIRGYLLWGTESTLTTVGGKILVPFPDKCWRFAINTEQGVIGGVEFTGDDWIKPPNGIRGYEIIDDGNRSLQVILDNATGKFYWISPYNGPAGSGLSKTFVDRDDTTGSGTEIACSITYGADTGSTKKHDIVHEVSNLTIDPHDPELADTTDHDSSGYRDGLEINFYAYHKANEWDTPYAQTLSVTKDGDITFDETPPDKANMIKITTNRSEFVISELINYYTAKEHAAVPSKRETAEGDYQTALASPALWLSRNPSLYKNLATGSSISGTPTAVAGVDGKSNSAFQISSALSTISVALSSGSVLLWADGTVVVTIGGEVVSLTSVGEYGLWTLYYATGITRTGVLILSPSEIRKIEDVRAYNSEITSAVRTYLYNDMVRNSGNNTLRLW